MVAAARRWIPYRSGVVAELHGVLLAAGGSSRLGRSKQLIAFRGEPLVRRGARLLLDLTSRVTVVTGAEGGAVAAALSDLDVDLRRNARWREGIGGSIALAIRGLGADTNGALILLCDQYLVGGADLDRLLRAWRAAPGRIAASRWGERFGPPVIFPKHQFGELERLRGDLGARQLLVSHRATVNFVDLPNAAADVDDASDLERLREWESLREAESLPERE